MRSNESADSLAVTMLALDMPESDDEIAESGRQFHDDRLHALAVVQALDLADYLTL
ncbi:MAG: hypothetical protein O2815_05810 [Actinomycetota bacterium]|nr:hypothetical protein [Actinomycetota bacterium]